jgi:DNA-binding NtrC family response regulator
MPATVLVVHDESDTLELAVAALTEANLGVVGFQDPMAALDAIEADRSRVRVLVTRADFGAGKLNGVALSRMLRLKLPGIKILFLALPGNREHTEGIGEFLSMPLAAGCVPHNFRQLNTWFEFSP